ncbi:unnamed protein product, partial [Pylaiella littoralis]
TGSRLKHVISDLIEGSMRICLDDDHDAAHTTSNSKSSSSGNSSEGDGSGFSLVLDEQWRG